MQIIMRFFMTPADYVAKYNSLTIDRPEKCPKCRVPNSFHAHGSYWRNVLTEGFEVCSQTLRQLAWPCVITGFLAL